MVEPTVRDLRLLSPSALALWKALVRERDRVMARERDRVMARGALPTVMDWFIADLRELAKNARLRYASAVRGLAALRRAGLIPTERDLVKRHIPGGKVVQAKEHNWYLVVGELGPKGVIKFPEDVWSRFVEQCPAPGSTRRKGSHRASIIVKTPRARFSIGTVWRPEWNAVDIPGLPNDAASFDAHTVNSPLILIKKEGSNSESKDAASADFLSPSEAEGMGDEGLDPEAEGETPEMKAWWAEMMAGLEGPRPPRPTPSWIAKPGRAPQKPVDSLVRTEQPPVQVIYDGMGPELRVRVMIEGYRQAVWKVYGVKYWGFTKTNVKDSKLYDRLLASADAMLENAMSPYEWCVWRLTWFKANAKRFAPKVPLFFIVLGAKTIRKLHGFFRQNYERPWVPSRMDYLHQEQRLRNEEAVRRHQGRETRDDVFGMTMPKWYVEKRGFELAMGVTDPLEMWPTRGKYTR